MHAILSPSRLHSDPKLVLKLATVFTFFCCFFFCIHEQQGWHWLWERKEAKTVNITFCQINPLYLHVIRHFGPVSLERVNPQTQRPKCNSCYPLTLPPSMEEWDCRCQGCRVPGWSTPCSGAHPTQCPLAIASGTPEPSSAPSDQGGSRDCSSMDRSAHASYGTTKDTQACGAWELSEVGEHTISWQKHTPCSDRLSWPMSCVPEAGLVQPSCPGGLCGLCSRWQQECLGKVWLLHRATESSQITHILSPSGLVLFLSHSNQIDRLRFN